jgi:hypothetical protein
MCKTSLSLAGQVKMGFFLGTVCNYGAGNKIQREKSSIKPQYGLQDH